jgi:hypothetical protein
MSRYRSSIAARLMSVTSMPNCHGSCSFTPFVTCARKNGEIEPTSIHLA